MNLITGAVRLWSSLTGWDLLLMGGTLAGVLLVCWWVTRWLDRKAAEDSLARTLKQLGAIMDMHEYRGPKKAGEHSQGWRKREKGDGAA